MIQKIEETDGTISEVNFDIPTHITDKKEMENFIFDYMEALNYNKISLF